MSVRSTEALCLAFRLLAGDGSDDTGGRPAFGCAEIVLTGRDSDDMCRCFLQQIYEVFEFARVTGQSVTGPGHEYVDTAGLDSVDYLVPSRSLLSRNGVLFTTGTSTDAR